MHQVERQVESCQCHIQQLLYFGRNATYWIRNRRITTPTIQAATRVHADDISLDKRPAVGDTVNYLVVDAGAGGGGEGRPAIALIGVILKQRLSTTATKVLCYHGINVGGGNTRGNDLAHQLVGLPHTNSGLSHQADFTFGFELYHTKCQQLLVVYYVRNQFEKATREKSLKFKPKLSFYRPFSTESRPT
jgi:hypothetical protein